MNGGTVEAWGDNTFGQLGNGSRTDSEVPTAVGGLDGVTAVAAGTEHSLALLSNGTVMAWGDNVDGQLGDGNRTSSEVPVAVKGLTGVKAISAGELFSAALLSDGNVVTWGYNGNGQLGDGTFTSRDVPVAVKALSGVTAIASGDQHTLALLGGGRIEAWGANDSLQLGHGNNASGDSPTPVAVVDISKATAVSAGTQHSVALLKNGTVMVWGDNGFFQLARPNGFPGGVGQSGVPLPVHDIPKATAIAAGGLFTLALTTSGTVEGWGDDAFGQLGDGSTTTGDTPAAVSGLSGITAIAAGGVASLALGTPVGTPPAPSSSAWHVQRTADPGPPSQANDFVLDGVSAAGPSDAWAVGQIGLGPMLPLAERWNGTAWQNVAVPLPSGVTQGSLRGIDDLAPNDAWAVGRQVSPVGGDSLTLIEHWNGSQWAVVASPNPETGPGAADELTAVSGTGPDDLWAVGFYSDGQTFNAMLFEHWDGSTWTFVPPPSVGEMFANAVTAVSASDVWAVGDTAGGTISAHWNGKAWRFVTTPFLQNGRAPTNQLTGITASGPDDLWASGFEGNVNDENLNDPYLLHWTGGRWVLVPVPDPGSEGSLLTGVTELSATDVWAVGITDQTDGSLLTLAEHYDGTTWAVAPTLDPGQSGGGPDSSFSGVGKAPRHTLFAVGAEESPGRCCLLTLAEDAKG